MVFFIQRSIIRFLCVVHDMKYCHLQFGFKIRSHLSLNQRKCLMRHQTIVNGFIMQYFAFNHLKIKYLDFFCEILPFLYSCLYRIPILAQKTDLSHGHQHTSQRHQDSS